MVEELGIPVKFIGVGEAVEDLQPFDAEAFVNAIFSWGIKTGFFSDCYHLLTQARDTCAFPGDANWTIPSKFLGDLRSSSFYNGCKFCYFNSTTAPESDRLHKNITNQRNRLYHNTILYIVIVVLILNESTKIDKNIVGAKLSGRWTGRGTVPYDTFKSIY